VAVVGGVMFFKSGCSALVVNGGTEVVMSNALHTRLMGMIVAVRIWADEDGDYQRQN